MINGYVERAITFSCGNSRLVGVVCEPASIGASVGLLVVVGGPQYRVGSHRQFVLLAREVATAGYPVLRFDYRGMGDAEGDGRNFEGIGEDIRSAVDIFLTRYPTLEGVVLWGLCDAASAALFYGYQDERVRGMVLLNPWVRTDAGMARTYLRHYYLTRLVDPAFWRKTLGGALDVRAALRGLAGNVRNALTLSSTLAPEAGTGAAPSASLPDRMLAGCKRFRGEILIILSGNDLVSDEFRDLIRGARPWRRALAGACVVTQILEAANHTFSSRVWRDQVTAWTLDWLRMRFQRDMRPIRGQRPGDSIGAAAEIAQP